MKKILTTTLVSAMLIIGTMSVYAEDIAVQESTSLQTEQTQSAQLNEQKIAYYIETYNKIIAEVDAYIYSNDLFFNGTDLAPAAEVYKKYKSALVYLLSEGITEETIIDANNAANAVYYQYNALQMDVDRKEFLGSDNSSLLESIATLLNITDYSNLDDDALYDAIHAKYAEMAKDSFDNVSEKYQKGIVAKFDDVTPSDWFYDAVKNACDNQLFLGTSNNSFTPDGTMTRAMFITVLGRLAKATYAGEYKSFSDVNNDEYYAPFVAWAKDNEILSWLNESVFEPDKNITREEMFACMYYTAQATGNNVSNTDISAISKFSDYEAVSSFAKDAAAWAVNMEIVNGNDDNTLSPNSTATRAEVAQIMKNFSSKVIIINENSWFEQLGK